MIIGDPLYLILLVSAALLAFFLPGGRIRAAFWLVCSYIFYLTYPISFFPSLLFVTLVAYSGGILIDKLNESQSLQSRPVTAIVLTLCLVPLLFYKYFVPHVVEVAGAGAANWDPVANQFAVPLGISFYTFGAVGYLIDVSIGVKTAERSLIKVALFCGFFPT